MQASALLTCSDPKDFGHLYVHLVEQPERLSAAGRQALNKRLREFLMKQWLTIGLPKVTVALYALTEVERPGDADLTFTKYALNTRQRIVACSTIRQRKHVGKTKEAFV